MGLDYCPIQFLAMYKWDCRALEVPHIDSSVYSWEILCKDLGLHLFKILLARQLKPRDHHMPNFFADWSLEQLETDPMFYRKIVFKEQSCHIWNDPENPVVKSRKMHRLVQFLFFQK